MKKLIVLFSSVIIAAGAAAQTERTATPATQATQAQGTTDRQAPVTSERGKRQNPVQEHDESANSVDPDFQGSSKQQTTSSGMGQPKESSERNAKSDKTKSDVQNVEDKTKK